jgi:hypothetical protein
MGGALRASRRSWWSLSPSRWTSPAYATGRAEFTALGLAESFDVPARVRELVDGGELVKAVRKLRRATPGRLSLVAAKPVVDAPKATQEEELRAPPRPCSRSF